MRDRDSLEELQRMGVPDAKVRLTADAVLTLAQQKKEQGLALLKKFGAAEGKSLVGISVRNWQSEENYLRELAQAADILIVERDVQIVLLPLQYPVDAHACKKVQQYMQHKDAAIILDAPCDTEQFLSVMGNLSLLIGMRLHALIFSAVMEVPFIAMSYDPKIDSFVKEAEGDSVGAINDFTATDIVALADKLFAGDDKCTQRLENLRSKALEKFQLAFALLRK